ncbi:choline kinase family protein [Paenibacillus soyae]|uniref:Phosphotransferase n=1 Tax=Paenibacillus soyae TaxID=2969249 RepID=A0A9X2MPN4_9BACL|nr:choline kinase family protein [Paenibacillus soyae]MCR2803568.1 phosphotransferase [Paenibacillus soyae]
MSDWKLKDMKIEEIIGLVPELNRKFTQYEALSGGFSNQTFKVITEPRSYVLRLNSKQNEYLNLTRQSEVEVMRKASQMGIAPEVIYADDPKRFFVTTYSEGRMLEKDDLQTKTIRTMIMDRLKSIHRMDIAQRTCTPYDLIFGYLKGADLFKVKQPQELKQILGRVEKIAYKRSDDKTYNNKFCHNDSFLCNMIFTGDQLQIIDWELSGIGDIFFELTLIPFSNRFNEAEEREWLTMYFGRLEEDAFHIFQDMKFVSMVREVAWGMFYSGLTKDEPANDFDYYKFAEYCVQRIENGIYSI